MPRPRHLTVLLLLPLLFWPRPRLLDAREADFFEDGGSGRIVGAMAGRLVGLGSSSTLQIEVGAQGPRVDPVLGFEGIRGTNIRTAREIELVQHAPGFRIVTRDARGNEVHGTASLGPRVKLPMRRLDADGSLVLDARTPRAYPRWIRFDTGDLPPGRYVTDVMVAGRSRLRAQFEVADGQGRITALGSRGEDEEVDR